MSTNTPVELNRGKRVLARQLLVFNGAMLIAGLWYPEALDIGKFILPFVFPSAIGLFIGDAYFANQRTTPTPRSRM
jgi:hypothetical protein